MSSSEGVVEAYEAPSWAEKLAVQPKWRTKLCLKPTPIHKWNLPGIPPGFEVAVKRDDLTGCLFSGNKIRKLDFCFGEAISKKCDCVITLGGVGSNHARVTALASRQLGLDSHLFLMTKKHPVKDVPCKGNYLLHRLSGANIYLIPPDHKPFKELIQVLDHFYEKLKSEGHSPYIIPAGGASAIGTWGYIDAWQEMMEQGVLDDYDDVVVAAGSQGTVCGLAIANHLTGSKLRIHGITIGYSADACYSVIQRELEVFGMKVTARDLLNIIGDYIGESYGKCTEDDLRFIIEVMSKTGLSLDPDFTVKAVRGMLTEMKERPHIFKGKRILFIHTGGIFGLFDGRIDDLAASSTDNNVKEASEVLPDFVW